MNGEIKEITYNDAINFLLPRHYSGRKPQITIAFGWYDSGSNLRAVCTFGKPASPQLCFGICGKEYSKNVYELNRLCKDDDFNVKLSQMVSKCLKYLKSKDWIVVSYSDIGMNHVGYIYQACNFIYTGKTKERTDKYTDGNKHSRHYNNNNQCEYRKLRTAKHRYIYFCTSNKKLKKQWVENLNYEIFSYPKGDNKRYILGQYQDPILIKIRKDQ